MLDGLGFLLQEFTKPALRYDREFARFERHHRRGARLVVKRHLAHIVARSVHVEDDFLAVVLAQVDLHAPRQDYVKRIRRIALGNDDGILRVVTHDAVRRERLHHARHQIDRRILRRIGSSPGHWDLLKVLFTVCPSNARKAAAERTRFCGRTVPPQRVSPQHAASPQRLYPRILFRTPTRARRWIVRVWYERPGPR